MYRTDIQGLTQEELLAEITSLKNKLETAEWFLELRKEHDERNPERRHVNYRTTWDKHPFKAERESVEQATELFNSTG